jgi:Tfp pilus assembly protein PilF
VADRYERAVVLDPDHAPAHANLGKALRERGRGDDAVCCYRRAVVLDPDAAPNHSNLGNALRDKGRPDEALRAYRRALALDPNLATAHHNLGVPLFRQGAFDEAVRAYRQALALDPKLARAHYNLGVALAPKGQLDDAVRCYRRALDLDPNLVEAHALLGETLVYQGRFTEAQAAGRRCLDLLPPNDRRRRPVAEQLRRCERFLALERKLPALLHGEARAAGAAVGRRAQEDGNGLLDRGAGDEVHRGPSPDCADARHRFRPLDVAAAVGAGVEDVARDAQVGHGGRVQHPPVDVAGEEVLDRGAAGAGVVREAWRRS